MVKYHSKREKKITDHYAIFHITNGSGTVAEQSEFIFKRDYRYNNILKFKESLAKNTVG